MKEECSPEDRMATQATEIAVLRERIEGMERAGTLQTEDLARRLEDTNRARQEDQEWRRRVDEALTILRSRRDTTIGIGAALISVITLAVVLLQYARGVVP